MNEKTRVLINQNQQNICLENTPPVINVNVAVGIAAYLNATQPAIPSWCDKVKKNLTIIFASLYLTT